MSRARRALSLSSSCTLPGIVKNGGSLDRALDRALFLVSE